MILTSLEVSQKQAYIFASNKLKENIANSAVIADILSPEYLKKILKGYPYSDEENMVYSGGGHTVLEFPSMEDAHKCTCVITETIYRNFNGLSVFAKSMVYDEMVSPGENLKNLTAALEVKKSIRKSAFHHGTFGIEKINSAAFEESADKKAISIKEEEKEKTFYPEGYQLVKKFEELGGSKNESNFIAIVHIDGNGMGKRIEELYETEKASCWADVKKKLRNFSDGIDTDFKDAFCEMVKIVGDNLKANTEIRNNLKIKDGKFPVRRVITAGDDICFVTEGRIGIECAVAFMQALAKKINSEDKKGYASCAGVAIVHQKYPFYKAYDLAEKLCSNAKKFNATINPEDNGRSISSIDWHIEFGEIGDTLEDVRTNYNTLDHNRMELRPYIVAAEPKLIEKYPAHSYESFLRLIINIKTKEKMYATGKIKELRGSLKEGKDMTKYYLTFNRMEDLLYETKDRKRLDLSGLFSGKKVENDAFILDYDGKEHSILFDAIELMDTFLKLDKEE